MESNPEKLEEPTAGQDAAKPATGGKYAKEGSNNNTMAWVGGSISLVLAGVFTFAYLHLVNQKAESYTMLEDGSFPVFDGWASLPMIYCLLFGFFAFAIAGRCFSALKDSKLSFGIWIASLFLGLTAVISAPFIASNHMYGEWKESLYSWADERYGLDDAAGLVSYRNPGIVGGYRGRGVAIYVEPPEDVRLLTNEKEAYIAELLPEQFDGLTLKAYEVRTDKKVDAKELPVLSGPGAETAATDDKQ